MNKYDFTLRVIPSCISISRELQYMDILIDRFEDALHERKDGQTIVKLGKMEYNFETMTATYYR